MMPGAREISCDLMVIGTGMAGMAAALFAAERDIDVVQAGMTGELNYASGLLDFMGVHPIETRRSWENPWKAIEAVVRDCPGHPYARLSRDQMQAGWKCLLRFFEQAGLVYRVEPEANLKILTPAGTYKTTYAVPETMLNGVRAAREKASASIFDFHGLKGFSGRQIVETLKGQWPQLETRRLQFPGATGELYPEQMARSLETNECRRALAEIIRPCLGRTRYVGLPAVLGIYRSADVFREMERLLERPVFEIPTMPPGITGLRLRQAFEQHLPRRGVHSFTQHTVFNVLPGRRRFRFKIGTPDDYTVVNSGAAILASGRFFGKGLRADRRRIVETVFGLPVHQPTGRSGWHREEFLDPRGHAINRAGLETDDKLRPLNSAGRPAFANLFAAGSILAHQDWMRMKCGTGLAITTAYAAIEAYAGRVTPPSASG